MEKNKTVREKIILPKNYVAGDIIPGDNHNKSFFLATNLPLEKQKKIRDNMEKLTKSLK